MSRDTAHNPLLCTPLFQLIDSTVFSHCSTENIFRHSPKKITTVVTEDSVAASSLFRDVIFTLANYR